MRTRKSGCYTGWVKLNFDGSVQDGSITGGGVFRDEVGRFILGYSIFFGDGSNNRAEFLALAEGLLLGQTMGFERICIDGDSAIVVSAIQTGYTNNWKLEYVIRQCLQGFNSGNRISHVYKQHNMVADRLADWAYEHQHRMDIY